MFQSLTVLVFSGYTTCQILKSTETNYSELHKYRNTYLLKIGQTGKVIKVSEKEVIDKRKKLKIFKKDVYMCMCIYKCGCPHSSEIAY